MMDAAKQFEADDKKKRDEIEIRNQADTAVFTAEKMLKESGDKLEADDKKKVEDGVAEVRKVLAAENIDDIKKAMETLNRSSVRGNHEDLPEDAGGERRKAAGSSRWSGRRCRCRSAAGTRTGKETGRQRR